MLSDPWWWIAIVWGVAFGWLFLSSFERAGELKKRLLTYVSRANSKFLLNLVDGLSVLLLMALVGCLVFWVPLAILPCGKKYFSSYFGFYLMGF